MFIIKFYIILTLQPVILLQNYFANNCAILLSEIFSCIAVTNLSKNFQGDLTTIYLIVANCRVAIILLIIFMLIIQLNCGSSRKNNVKIIRHTSDNIALSNAKLVVIEKRASSVSFQAVSGPGPLLTNLPNTFCWWRLCKFNV